MVGRGHSPQEEVGQWEIRSDSDFCFFMSISKDGSPLFYKRGYDEVSYEILETETMRETEKEARIHRFTGQSSQVCVYKTKLTYNQNYPKSHKTLIF